MADRTHNALTIPTAANIATRRPISLPPKVLTAALLALLVVAGAAEVDDAPALVPLAAEALLAPALLAAADAEAEEADALAEFVPLLASAWTKTPPAMADGEVGFAVLAAAR